MSCLRRIGLFVAAVLFTAGLAQAQSQYAGTYIGTLNTRVSIPGVTTIESSFGAYIAVVSADGTFNLNSGALTGSVSASGAVTIGAGTSFALLNIRSAQIANNQLSSDYGSPSAPSNNTSSYRINPSTGFTPAAGGGGGGTGGGGTGGGGTGGGGTGGGGTAGGDLLAYYSFNDATNPLRDESGRNFHLTALGQVSRIDGRFGAGALRTANVRLRTLVNSSFSTTAATISLFVRPTGAGQYNPRLAAIGPAGSSSQFYGLYLEGATTNARRVLSLQDGNGSYPPSASAAGAVPTSTSTWTHVALVHTGSEARIYINGNLSSTTSNRRALGTFNTAMLSIAGSDNGLDLFTGDLDEIKIYNRALTAAEISTLNTGGTVGSAATGTNTAAAVAATSIAAPISLTGYRSRVGQSFELIVTGSSSGSVWGTDVYTDDSTVARAAVHAGVIAVGETKTVTVTILPGQGSYTASTRNGVSTSSWGAWGGSFSFAGSSGSAVVAGTASVLPSIPASYIVPSLNVVLGGRFVLPVPVTGTGPFTYQWFLNGVAISQANGGTVNPYIVNSVTAATAGTYTVRVTGPAGTAPVFTVGTLTVPATANAPQIVLQPFDKTVSPGGTFALAASAIGNGITYQWLRNGVIIPASAGGTNAILLRQNADSTDAGTYTVRITGGGSTVTSIPAVVTIDANASRLSNLSGRISISGSDRVIPAFVIAGTGKKRVLIRAVGPGLAAFGVGGTMADPKFELYDGNTKIAENNDWSASIASSFAAVGAFNLPANSKDAAGVFELDAGKGYSIHVMSNTSDGGVVLFEVYDLGNVGGGSKFANVSVRGGTGTGDATLILGLNIAGVGKRTLLTRGVGPQLADFGVSGTIADPKLQIFDSNQRIVMENNDWASADFVTEMLQAREFVGAFALNGNSADASTLVLLDPGSYTMQITAGSGATSGEALVEIYEVP